MKRKIIRIACVVFYTMMLSGCREILDMPVGSENEAYSEAEPERVPGQYEMTNYDYETSDAGAVPVDLTHPAENAGDFYTFDGRQFIIHKAGTYLLAGRLEQGKLVINVCEDEVVRLICDGVEIRSAEGAALYVENAAKVILTMKDGTENTLSDGPEYDDEIKACVFSNSDLTINGSGFLAVYGYHADAVRSKDQLKIVDTMLYVKSKKDGIRGNDGVIIVDSEVEAECEGTGILSTGAADMVVIQGGSCKVIAGEYAVSANRFVSVSECLTDLYAVLETIRCDGIRELQEGLAQ